MPHQCVRCSTFYDDGSDAILKGCSCGGRLFFYIKKEKLEQAKKVTSNLTEEAKQEIEKDVFELVGNEAEVEDPVVLDFESIRVLQPGKYEIDLVHLFKKEPLVFKLDDGKYMIDVVQTFKQFSDIRKEKESKPKGKHSHDE